MRERIRRKYRPSFWGQLEKLNRTPPPPNATPHLQIGMCETADNLRQRQHCNTYLTLLKHLVCGLLALSTERWSDYRGDSKHSSWTRQLCGATPKRTIKIVTCRNTSKPVWLSLTLLIVSLFYYLLLLSKSSPARTHRSRHGFHWFLLICLIALLSLVVFKIRLKNKSFRKDLILSKWSNGNRFSESIEPYIIIKSSTNAN